MWGARLWQLLPEEPPAATMCNDIVGQLCDTYDSQIKSLPKRPPVRPRQPYLAQATLDAFAYLCEWRSQLRTLQDQLRRTVLKAAWRQWRGDQSSMHDQLHLQRLVIGAYCLQERKLQRRVHDLARRDKVRHLSRLTSTAAAVWHSTGQPMPAIVHLKWASRRAADRRAVFAAGGYDIQEALEEQFRAQEGGMQVTPPQLEAKLRAWAFTPAPCCHSALPTLSDMEYACLRQRGGKAPGPDGIPNEVWRMYPPQAGRWLWQLCSRITVNGREPSRFKKALQHALYKKGPAALPANYRSIALLNGVAKLWHGHLRSTIGLSLLSRYDPLQLGGRKGVPVSFAVMTFRNVWDFGVQRGRCSAALFVDVQAAYYETSRQLLFHGDASMQSPADSRLWHLAELVHELATHGALAALGTPPEELALFLDCVSCSHWQLVGSDRVYVATRGSRPGDGLADILFGALFAVALRHIRAACRSEQIWHASAGALIGRPNEVVPIGWADDLAVLADFATPVELQSRLPRLADIVISTLEFLRFRVNLGPGKTEAIVDIRGDAARKVKSDMLAHASELLLPDGRAVRLAPEYRYLGVIQQPRDNGRRDQELSLQRAQAAWVQARGLFSSSSLPIPLKRAWLAGRVLPAAYATLATTLAVSLRATAPLEGFFERATRVLVQSWQFGHMLTKPCLCLLSGLCAPQQATVVARTRLVTQLCKQATPPVWELFTAAWNRATPGCELLIDACAIVLPAIEALAQERYVTLPLLQAHFPRFVRACKHMSRYGTAYRAFWELWRDVGTPRSKKVIGVAGHYSCTLCAAVLPSQQALAAHTHRKHSVVNVLTRFTCGTVCIWCHTEHFSTDRLKYHLRRSSECLHGLRVTVGECYSYGTGSRRTGLRGHRGFPPIRLPGPINATPAQRAASLRGRQATPEELSQELFHVTGSRLASQWPSAEPPPSLDVRPSPSVVCCSREPSQADPTTSRPSWRCFCDDLGTHCHLPSPFWPGLARCVVFWGLPAAWHRYWTLWSAAEHFDKPFDFRARHAQRPIRAAADAQVTNSGCQVLVMLAAATVTFKHICSLVVHSGMLWIPGVPCASGLSLLRRLLPDAVFHVFPTAHGRIFVAAHRDCAVSSWRASLPAVVDAAVSPVLSDGLFLQPSLVYRSGSLGTG